MTEMITLYAGWIALYLMVGLGLYIAMIASTVTGGDRNKNISLVELQTFRCMLGILAFGPLLILFAFISGTVETVVDTTKRLKYGGKVACLSAAMTLWISGLFTWEGYYGLTAFFLALTTLLLRLAAYEQEAGWKAARDSATRNAPAHVKARQEAIGERLRHERIEDLRQSRERRWATLRQYIATQGALMARNIASQPTAAK